MEVRRAVQADEEAVLKLIGAEVGPSHTNHCQPPIQTSASLLRWIGLDGREGPPAVPPFCVCFACVGLDCAGGNALAKRVAVVCVVWEGGSEFVWREP